MKIYINGWSSFEEWRDAGYPGARSFNADGTVKGKTTHLAKCQVLSCNGSMVERGYCRAHARFYQGARSA
jgi:hypothetical protein